MASILIDFTAENIRSFLISMFEKHYPQLKGSVEGFHVLTSKYMPANTITAISRRGLTVAVHTLETSEVEQIEKLIGEK